MNKKALLILGIAVLIGFASLIFVKKPKNNPVLPTREVAIGFWTHGLWDNDQKRVNPQSLINLEEKFGKKAAIAHIYVGWEDLKKNEAINELEKLSANGWTPMISVNPYFTDTCKANGKTLYEAIANGSCDTQIREIGSNLSQFKKPFFLRFAWEMNVDTVDWSVSKTGSSAVEFKQAWSRTRNLIIEEGVTNAIWVFSPQVNSSESQDFAIFYPGDDQTDWVGLDGYNWGTTQSWSDWREFDEIYRDSYQEMLSVAKNKKFMIAEVNSTNQGGDKSIWLQKMLATDIPENYKEIDAVVFFDEDKTLTENVNWSFDGDKDALKTLKQELNKPIYSSELTF